MASSLKTLLKIAAGLVASLIVIGAMVWLQLRPLPPSAAAQPGGVVSGVTVIEPGIGRRENQTIVVASGVIAEIRDATAADTADRGRFVVPGLIDMHVHQPTTLGGLADYFALLYLRHGVTSVRYTGHTDTGTEVERQRDRINAGELAGPRLFSCGPIIDGDPPLWSTSVVLTAPAQADAAVARLADAGVDCIKVYANLEANVLAAVVSAAHERGLRVVGHVPSGVALEAAGIDDVQHLIGVPGPPPAPDAGNPMLDGWPTLSDERVAEVAERSNAQLIAHTPTLVFQWTNSLRDRHDELVASTSAHLLPRLFRDVAWKPQASIRLGGERSEQTQNALRGAFQRQLEVVGRLHREGVTIQAGSDSANPFVVQGAALAQELALLTEAGLTPEEALAAATSVPGGFLPVARLGRIEKGAPADFLLLAADPTVSLDALDSIVTVVAGGRFYSSAWLEAEVQRYRAHYDNFTWDTILPALIELTR